MIAVAHPLLGTEEEVAMLRVLASGQLAQGEQVATFEQRFAELFILTFLAIIVCKIGYQYPQS